MSAPSLSDLTPGTRVVVSTPGHLNGVRGVVIEMALGLLNGHDVAVHLDRGPASGPLCFYCHELAVAS